MKKIFFHEDAGKFCEAMFESSRSEGCQQHLLSSVGMWDTKHAPSASGAVYDQSLQAVREGKSLFFSGGNTHCDISC